MIFFEKIKAIYVVFDLSFMKSTQYYDFLSFYTEWTHFSWIHRKYDFKETVKLLKVVKTDVLGQTYFYHLNKYETLVTLYWCLVSESVKHSVLSTPTSFWSFCWLAAYVNPFLLNYLTAFCKTHFWSLVSQVCQQPWFLWDFFRPD